MIKIYGHEDEVMVELVDGENANNALINKGYKAHNCIVVINFCDDTICAISKRAFKQNAWTMSIIKPGSSNYTLYNENGGDILEISSDVSEINTYRLIDDINENLGVY